MSEPPQLVSIKDFPAHKLDDARHALELAHARLVRSAAKAGQSAPVAPTLIVRESRTRSRCRACLLMVDGFPPSAHHCLGTAADEIGSVWISIEVVDLELSAGRPALAGWVFLAVVEPLEGGNLIRQVPGADVSEGELAPWATGTIACDHCRAKRQRAETFIVRADGADPAIPAGTYKQVGRQCLAAFLGGKSAASIIAQLAWPDVVRSIGEGDGGGWGSGSRVFDPLAFLVVTAAVIRLDGWMSKGQARAEECRATADSVLYLMTPPFRDPGGNWRREVERCRPTSEDRDRAAAALEWAKGLGGDNDYERNLALVARQPGLKPAHAGLLASAVSSYVRMLGRETELRRQTTAAALAPSQHVGAIKDRLELELTVQHVASIDTDYGALHIISMRDASNNSFVWKTGTTSPKPGEMLKLRGTVKGHEEFRSEKQTILTRCTILTSEAQSSGAWERRSRLSTFA